MSSVANGLLWMDDTKFVHSKSRPFKFDIQVEPGKPGAEVSKKKNYK